jgi:Kef-type K+ transport system membrane component KefB
MMPHALQVLLLLSLIVASAKVAGAASNRLGQPAVFGELLVGLLLGPTLLDVLGWSVFTGPAGDGQAPSTLLPLVRDLAQIGVVLLMFIAGLETNLGEMRRVGHVAFWAAVGGVALPFAGGAAVAVWCGLPLAWEGLFVGAILTATSVSISAQTLMELGVLRSREGTVILGAAVIDDVIGILVLSFVVAFARTNGHVDLASTGMVLGRMIGFFALAYLLGTSLSAVGRWAERLRVSQALLAIVLAVVFVYAWSAEALGGVAAITGAYLAGVFFARTPFKSRIDAGIHPLTYSMFVPVFFVGIGLEADARHLGGRVLFTLLLVIVAIVSKALGCGVGARVMGMTRRESVRVGVGMISRGEVGLIVAGYGLAHGLIDTGIFSASVLMVLATTLVTPPLLRLAFPPRGARREGMVEETVAGPPVNDR